MSAQDMTEAEVKLQDEKLRAEVSKLIAEVSKVMADTDRARAEVTKMVAEAGHLKMSTVITPFLAAAGLMGATAAVVKIFF